MDFMPTTRVGDLVVDVADGPELRPCPRSAPRRHGGLRRPRGRPCSPHSARWHAHGRPTAARPPPRRWDCHTCRGGHGPMTSTIVLTADAPYVPDSARGTVGSVADVTGDPNPTESAGLPTFNPLAPGFAADPYRQYRGERWPATRCTRACSGRGCSSATTTAPDPARPDAERGGRARAEPRAELRERVSTSGRSGATAASSTSIRPTTPGCARLVSKAFTPRRSSSCGRGCRQLVDELLDEVAPTAATRLDLISDLAFPLPSRSSPRCSACPTADRDQLREWSHTMTPGARPDPRRSANVRRDHRRVRPHDRAHLAAIAWKRRPTRPTTCSPRSSPPRTTATCSPRTSSRPGRAALHRRPRDHREPHRQRHLALLRNRDQLERWRPTRRSTPTRSRSCCATTARCRSPGASRCSRVDGRRAHDRARQTS